MSHHPSPVEQPQLALAIFDAPDRAAAAIRALQSDGFPDDRLSVLARHRDSTEITPEEAVALEREAEATSTSVALGSTVGGLAGLLGGLAIFAVPGIGPLFGAGVLATTIGGAVLGAAAGERAAHFRELGLPEHRSERYQRALESEEIIVAVEARNGSEAMRAREILALHEALEIDVHPVRQP